MPDTSYIGRRYAFETTSGLVITGTVASEPFSIRIGQANGPALTDEVTHGCIAVSLDPAHRGHLNGQAESAWVGTIIGHVDDVVTDEDTTTEGNTP